MRLNQLLLLVAFGITSPIGCGPKEGGKTQNAGMPLPSAENGYGDPKQDFSEGVRILKTPDKSGNVDYAKALQWFEFATKANPEYAKAWYNAGWAAERVGNSDLAATYYRTALDKDPANKSALLNLGSVLSELGRGDEAVDLYQGYVEKNPTDLDARNNLIEALTSARRYDDAIEQTRQILRRDPKNVDAYRNLSRIYFAKGDNGMSQLCAEKAKTMAKGDPGIYNNMGVTYLVMNDEPAAISEFKEAVKLSPTNLEANMNLGFVALNSGDYELAKQSFEAALKKDPGNVDGMLGLAVALRGVKDYDGAGKLYDQIIAADPNNPIPYYNAATLYEKYVKDFKKAGKYLDTWIQRNEGKLSPDDDVFKLKDRINESQAAEEERKRQDEEKKKQAADRLARQKETFEKLKGEVKKLESDLTTYANCPAMIESGAIDQGSMVLEQAKVIVEAEEVDMAGDIMSFFDELRPQLDAIIPQCGPGTAAPTPAPADGATAPAPADGTAPAPTEGKPAEGGGGAP